MRRTLLALLALTIVNTGACAARTGAAAGEPAAVATTEFPTDMRVAVLVENTSRHQAAVYVKAGTFIRLGEVNSHGQEVFWLPPEVVRRGTVQLYTRQVAGGSFTSEIVSLGRGQLVFRIRDHLPESYIMIR